MCLFYSLLILSSVSVVFDFNDSLNDVALASPITSSVGKNMLFDNANTPITKHKRLAFLCLTSQVENLTGNNVHHKSNMVN